MQINFGHHNRPLSEELIALGNANHITCNFRTIVGSALAAEAAAIVVAHNHPSGSASPSKADRLATQHLKAVLGVVDVELWDHVIVTQTDAFSMRLAGML